MYATGQKIPSFPSLDVVTKLIQEKKGNYVPVFVRIPADLITPSMAYLRMSHNSKYSFLLESIIGGENMGRYSFLGAGRTKILYSWATL